MSMEVSAFLIHLAVDGHMAASTQNLALSALLFLYREVLEQDFGWLENVVRVKKPKRLPVVFSPEANNRCQALIAPAIGARHFSVRSSAEPRQRPVLGECGINRPINRPFVPNGPINRRLAPSRLMSRAAPTHQPSRASGRF
jgi:hypothetical protein